MRKNLTMTIIVLLLLFFSACGGAPEEEYDWPFIYYASPLPSPSPTPTPTPEPDIEHVYGNSAGNISNGAFVAGDGENIFYIRRARGDGPMTFSDIVRLAPDGSSTVLLEGGQPECLNVYGGYVYYIDGITGTICRIAADGSGEAEAMPVPEDCRPVLSMAIEDGIIHFLARHGEYVARYSLVPGEEARLEADIGTMRSAFAVYEGNIYYCAMGNVGWNTCIVNIERAEVDGNVRGYLHSLCIADGRLYYIDENSQISCMEPDGELPDVVAGGISAFALNAEGEWLYYSDGTAIYALKADGSELKKVCDYPSSNFVELNVLDGQIYVSDNGGKVFTVSAEGGEIAALG